MKSFYPFIPLIFFAIFMMFMMFISSGKMVDKDVNLKKVEQGLASKITYNDHSYIVWSVNLGGGIVHDPECKCKSKE